MRFEITFEFTIIVDDPKITHLTQAIEAAIDQYVKDGPVYIGPENCIRATNTVNHYRNTETYYKPTSPIKCEVINPDSGTQKSNLGFSKITYEDNGNELLKILDIDQNQLSKEAVDFITSHEPLYRDNVLNEHIYNLYDFEEELAEVGPLYKEITKITKILNKKKAAYLRIINLQ